MNSSVDIGNPIYKPTPPRVKGEGIARCEIFFSGGDRSEFINLDYEWEKTPDGIQVFCDKPDFSEYIQGPDDLKSDVMLAIEADLGKTISGLLFTWL